MMIFLKKIHGNVVFSSNVLKKWSSKKITLKYDLSCIIWKDDIAFYQKYDSFSRDGKWKMIFLKKWMVIWWFLYIWLRWCFFFLQIWNYPSAKKSKDYLLPKEKLKDDISGINEKDDTHPKKDDIGILDWHYKKSSNDSLCLYGDPF